MRLHEAFREPHGILASIPFANYEELADECSIDLLTLQVLKCVTAQRMNDFTCLAWEIEPSLVGDFGKNGTHQPGQALNRIVETGEQIMDLIRLFLFKPGEDATIGRVGGLGSGISGAWFGDSGGTFSRFIARKTARFQLVQDPMERGIADVRRIYNDPVFRELCSVVCAAKKEDPLLNLVLRSLRALRESRDIQAAEPRFQRLASVAEDLARRNQTKRLQGTELRNRVASMADRGWQKEGDILAATKDLWDNARNPLAHSANTFAMIGRDSSRDIATLEMTVIKMIQSAVLDWRDEEFHLPST
ncbi:MAG: hypothetical protein ABSG41_03495 [Bryobacteraceae bacterium]